MVFDILSMKQRAKALMSTMKPSPVVVKIIFGLMVLAYVAAFLLICATMDENSGMWLLQLLLVEMVYLNFRTSCRWYCLKTVREEETALSDVLLAFKEKPIKAFLVGFIKDLCMILGFFCLVGAIFPFYWFRFATYVVYDYDDISVLGALGKSMKLLKGHYLELIKIDISNIGWFFLAYYSMGLASFWVKPYTTVVYAEFYDYLKGQEELFG